MRFYPLVYQNWQIYKQDGIQPRKMCGILVPNAAIVCRAVEVMKMGTVQHKSLLHLKCSLILTRFRIYFCCKRLH